MPYEIEIARPARKQIKKLEPEVRQRISWREVFSFEGGNAFDVDYEDYH